MLDINCLLNFFLCACFDPNIPPPLDLYLSSYTRLKLEVRTQTPFDLRVKCLLGL